ncbi:DEAD/DEAH box helicase family protein [Neiella marina]|uniref:DEAD/DEAH box helicase family protein n=1 Tax=Neiella holothuriorum TaxID=2870530 RepID=A0ABS7EHL3_9GAMM|nr:helicase-related protein [Neiella holothuriorum]MBW8191815.1 DEAD/DEAH box helicase family protein [Neiella holothuriorum]
MHQLLQICTNSLQRFLEESLPKLSPDWWASHVIDRLSFQQQSIATERGFSSLSDLDLAALLRIVDQNWFELSQTIGLPREARNWIKELQTVRNKWAHLSREMPASEEYRDADTMWRLLQALGIDEDVLAEIELYRQSKLNSITVSAEASQETAPKEDKGNHSNALFKIGEIICLRSDNSKVFPVIALEILDTENTYQVFDNGEIKTYFESQLQSMAAEEHSDSAPTSVSQLLAALAADCIRYPSSKNLYSLRSGNINFVPYQYRPAIKMVKAEQPRILIADEVGVGKTIEAGLIIKELSARMDLESILIICPKALVAERKWELEMKRFNESFIPLDGRGVRYCINECDLDGTWPQQYNKAIFPFSLFDSNLLNGDDSKRRKQLGLLDLDPPPKFDLVIVDEAHHIRNADTYLHQAVKYFCDNANAVVFLSATPVQLGSKDLFTLLNVLRPDLIIDENSFHAMAAPNRYTNEAVHICREAIMGWPKRAQAALQSASATEWGRMFLRETPEFQRIFDALGQDKHSEQRRVSLISEIESLNTFRALINRTRRRDIGDFTIRKPETLSISFTPEQKALHDGVLAIIARIMSATHGKQNIKFMMTTIRRQAASCLYGLAPMLDDILGKKLDSFYGGDSIDAGVSSLISDIELSEIKDDIKQILSLAESLSKHDPKAEAFQKMITTKQRLENRKIIIFTTFRHTIAYLKDKLEENGCRFGVIHGAISDEERRDIRYRFSLPSTEPSCVDVLLSSEVGCEGLDFQFCDCLFNYDLPWNPMKVEQRVGRIDRYGQQSEAVAIVNFITPETVDADIYERCLNRIGVFEHAIGGCEEILGDISSEILRIADNFNLSDTERKQKLQQLADNKIRLIEEHNELSSKQSELFGLAIPTESNAEEDALFEQALLKPQTLAVLLNTYLSNTLGVKEDFIDDSAHTTLSLNAEQRRLLRREFSSSSRNTSPAHKLWLNWLEGSASKLRVTFDPQEIDAKQEAVLLTTSHPLVQQAASALALTKKIESHVSIATNSIPPGRYPFALYRWSKKGIKADELLVGVSSSEEIEKQLVHWLVNADTTSSSGNVEEREHETLRQRHHSLWVTEQANHAASNRQLSEYRIQSLTNSHKARCQTIFNQMDNSTNDKIRRMKESELARANADFTQRLSTLEIAAESGDVHATELCIGTIEVISQQ